MELNCNSNWNCNNNGNWIWTVTMALRNQRFNLLFFMLLSTQSVKIYRDANSINVAEILKTYQRTKKWFKLYIFLKFSKKTKKFYTYSITVWKTDRTSRRDPNRGGLGSQGIPFLIRVRIGEFSKYISTKQKNQGLNFILFYFYLKYGTSMCMGVLCICNNHLKFTHDYS